RARRIDRRRFAGENEKKRSDSAFLCAGDGRASLDKDTARRVVIPRLAQRAEGPRSRTNGYTRNAGALIAYAAYEHIRILVCVSEPALERSLGALRQPRDDRAFFSRQMVRTLPGFLLSPPMHPATRYAELRDSARVH